MRCEKRRIKHSGRPPAGSHRPDAHSPATPIINEKLVYFAKMCVCVCDKHATIERTQRVIEWGKTKAGESVCAHEGEKKRKKRQQQQNLAHTSI